MSHNVRRKEKGANRSWDGALEGGSSTTKVFEYTKGEREGESEMWQTSEGEEEGWMMRREGGGK